MNPDEMKEVQQLQELLTKFNSETSFAVAQRVVLAEPGENGAKIGHFDIGDDGETMFFTQFARRSN